MSVKERQLLLAAHATLFRDTLDTHCSFLRALYGMVNARIVESVDPMLPQLEAMAASPDGMALPRRSEHVAVRHSVTAACVAWAIICDTRMIYNCGMLCPVGCHVMSVVGGRCCERSACGRKLEPGSARFERHSGFRLGLPCIHHHHHHLHRHQTHARRLQELSAL